MKTINLFPTSEVTDTMSRWSFCYLHGMAEYPWDNPEAGDIFYADCKKPSEGSHAVTIRGEQGVAVINADGSGRVVLVSDTLALKHALSGEWE